MGYTLDPQYSCVFPGGNGVTQAMWDANKLSAFEIAPEAMTSYTSYCNSGTNTCVYLIPADYSFTDDQVTLIKAFLDKGGMPCPSQGRAGVRA